MNAPHSEKTKRRALRTGRLCALVGGGMLLLSFASVPLYRIFCQVTGYGGTPRIVSPLIHEQSKTALPSRTMNIRFDANTASDLPWTFAPADEPMDVQTGDVITASYRAHSQVNEPTKGRAVFNITPEKAALYVLKIECFCFTEQTLAPFESTLMPLTFRIDPAITENPEMEDVRTITFSYTFYPLTEEAMKR